MFGRFLACIALLTGLVAVSTPASASMLQSMNCEIGVAADKAEDSANDRRVCPDDHDSLSAEDPGKTDKPERRTKRIIRPPVLYGIDRAYE